MTPQNWLSVIGWEGLYEVRADGAVRSVSRTVVRRDGSLQRFRSVALSPQVNAKGYLIVRLSDASNDRRRMARVHRLVAEAFIPNPLGLPEVPAKPLTLPSPRDSQGHSSSQA